MSKTSEAITALAEKVGEEDAKFDSGNQSAGTRSRAHLQEIKKLCQERREEIQSKKNTDEHE